MHCQDFLRSDEKAAPATVAETDVLIWRMPPVAAGPAIAKVLVERKVEAAHTPMPRSRSAWRQQAEALAVLLREAKDDVPTTATEFSTESETVLELQIQVRVSLSLSESSSFASGR